jgi:uncharacterized protein (TIGR00299 family) protein
MIVHLDLSTGASGDKLLAALLGIAEQTGAYSLTRLQGDLASLVPGAVVTRTDVSRGGISAPHIEVRSLLADVHDHSDPPTHDRRSWKDIRELIEGSDLPDDVRGYALSGFMRIAEAEARVHGTTPEKVHFHEVGALDSIVDIVGCALLRCALEALEETGQHAALQITATPIALGSGTVTCAHGILPVPAPATAQLVIGLPVEAGSASGELTTPTGAALVADMVTAWGPLPPMRPLALGYGAGSRQLPGVANVLTAIIGTQFGIPTTPTATPAPFAHSHACDDRTAATADDRIVPINHVEGVILLETNLDHLSGEAASFACDAILSKGALDVWQEPLTMKKGRLGIGLCVLSRPLDADFLAECIQLTTGTLGVRRSYLERYTAMRGEDELVTSQGRVHFKSMCVRDAREEGRSKTSRRWVRPEADDVTRLLCDARSPYARMAETLADEATHILRNRLSSDGTDTVQ